MSSTEEHTNETRRKQSKWKPLFDWFNHTGVIVTIIGACVLMLAIIWFAYETPDWSQKMNILTVGILGVITFVIAVINATSTARTVDMMEQQVAEMTAQRIAAEKQNTLSEQSVELARLSAKITEDQLQLAKLIQRPDINLILTFAPIGHDNRIVMLFNAPNVGQTTAYRFGIHISVDWRPKNFDGVLHYGKPNADEAEPIRVGVPHFIHPAPVPCPRGTIISMQSGETWMIVFGIYSYYDGVGNKYEEIFCRRFNHLDPENAVQCDGSLRSKVIE